MSPNTRIVNDCFVNVPFNRLKSDLLKIVLDNRIRPEIGLVDNVLYDEPTSEFVRIAKLLKSEGLACTLHAPFQDLIPSALDPEILKASRNKLKKAFALLEIFEPHSIVCHPNFEPSKHGTKEKQWLEQSYETWHELLQMAKSCQIPMMLENTYEKSPSQLHKLLLALDSPYARFCLDVGHVMAFAKNRWQDWLPTLEPWLGQLHLHDNDGTSDSHLGVGEGIFNFKELFSYLNKQQIKPLITLEPHQEEELWRGFTNIERMNLFPLTAPRNPQ
ncbi:MAG: sugar phosphate isomerase/epimerase [Desulfobulbaceae bacterium]|nr:sugar phosphate isomerase/epimerase [Desulfobulbaceae bacterium]